MRQALLLAALCAMSAGALVGLVWGVGPKWAKWAAYSATAAGSALVGVAGAASVAGAPLTVNLGNLLDFGQTSLRLDPLAGMFLTLTGALGTVISLALLTWSLPPGWAGQRAVAPGYALLLASVTVAISASDAFSFLFAWEALTVSFYILSAATRHRPGQPADAWATAAIAKAGGGALLVGFLLLAGAARSFGLPAWAGIRPGALHDTAYALLVFGFGTKVGLAPFQVWMPRGYRSAPGPCGRQWRDWP